MSPNNLLVKLMTAAKSAGLPLFPCTPKAAWTPRETRKARRGGRLSTLTVAMKKVEQEPISDR
jgi:hypothetical protein